MDTKQVSKKKKNLLNEQMDSEMNKISLGEAGDRIRGRAGCLDSSTFDRLLILICFLLLYFKESSINLMLIQV